MSMRISPVAVARPLRCSTSTQCPSSIVTRRTLTLKNYSSTTTTIHIKAVAVFRRRSLTTTANANRLTPTPTAPPLKPPTGSVTVGGASQNLELAQTRTVGIIAHIDAGKTTTTERMLYYSGLIDHIGGKALHYYYHYDYDYYLSSLIYYYDV